MHSVKSQVKSVIPRLKARTFIRPPSMFLLQLEYGFNLHSEKKRKKKKEHSSAFILLLLAMVCVAVQPLKRM
jgi:hypothetical protein